MKKVTAAQVEDLLQKMFKEARAQRLGYPDKGHSKMRDFARGQMVAYHTLMVVLEIDHEWTKADEMDWYKENYHLL